MKSRHLRTLVALLAVVSLNASGQSGPVGASLSVADVTFTDRRAVEIAKAIAERYKVVIGVSGVLIGPDDHLVSVSIKNGTIKDVLDALVKADPRFTWRQEDDGGIAVVTTGAPLSVLDVVVKTFDTKRPSRSDLTIQIINLPEVKDWLQKNACRMIEVYSGTGSPTRLDTWPIELHLKDVRLGALLNRIALESKTYFWTAVQFSDHPCAINMRP